MIKPMLAHKYDDHAGSVRWPAIVQPKLNGIRAIATGGKFYSRNAKEFTSVSHLAQHIPTWDVPIDGELYNHDWSFQRIASAVKRINPNRDSEKIQYWVYDCVMDAPYDERYSYLMATFDDNPMVFVVPSFAIIEEELSKHHSTFVEFGFEGTIVRNMDSRYQQDTRSRSLLKYKDFVDKEFKIVGAKGGTGKEVGLVIWTCEMDDGNRFDVRPRGTYAERERLYKRRSKYIGKLLTVRYQNLSESGTPIFPVGIAIRDYE